MQCNPQRQLDPSIEAPKCITAVATCSHQEGVAGNWVVTDAAPLLAGRLVEPCLDIVLPVLLEVTVGDNVVVLHHLALFLSYLPAHQHNHAISKGKQQTGKINEPPQLHPHCHRKIPSKLQHHDT
jgi:hypothetical protein